MICKHCGKNIVRRRFYDGMGWVHQPVGAAFQDATHRYCHVTAAEPDKPERPTSLHPQVGQPRETR